MKNQEKQNEKTFAQKILDNKYWILATLGLTAVIVGQKSKMNSLQRDIDISHGVEKNQADIISGLLGGIKNLSYHLGKTKSENSETV